jgi:ribonucleoside-triphosphate reductase
MSAQSPAGMMMKFAGELTKPFSKQYFLAPNIRQAMNDNYMYVHDLDYYPTKSTTCVQTPLNKLLEGGLYAGHGEIRPAKRIETAVIVAAISLETTQNEQHGGQAIPAFDFYMAPYVRKTYEEEVEKIAEVLGWDDAKIREHKDLAIGDYDVDRFEGYAKIIIARTVNRVHQAMESFIHNCNNIHSRGGLTLG